MAEARIEVADELPEVVVVCAIQAGCSPLAIETAVSERGDVDTLLLLAPLCILRDGVFCETDVSMTLIGALVERWGISS